MTTQEQWDAAEGLLQRLHAVAKTVDVYEYGLPLGDEEAGPEMRALVLAFAGHKPDDGDPITAEWLGWRLADVKDERMYGLGVRNCYIGSHASFGLTEQGGQWRLFSIDADEFDGSETLLAAPEDRGHLRRLCAALRIPLTEPR